MLKVVIDTNVFISSFFGGVPREIIHLWKTGRITICLSQEIIEEYIEVLNRLGLKNKQEIIKLTKLFAEGYNSIFTAKTPNLIIVEDDPNDNKFLECAVALDSKVIISGDKHLKNISILKSCHQGNLLNFIMEMVLVECPVSYNFSTRTRPVTLRITFAISSSSSEKITDPARIPTRPLNRILSDGKLLDSTRPSIFV